MIRFTPALLLAACVFAQDHFASPPDAAANLPARPISSDDLLAITVYGAPELSRAVRVSEDGTVHLPMLDRAVPAVGLMPEQVEKRIASELAKEDVLVNPAVTVSIAEYHTRPISVVGAVRQPLTFPVSGKITLLDALARAQGLNAEAGQVALVTRPGRKPGDPPTVERVDLKALTDGADPASNVSLEGGEEVRVPQAGRVFVVGNVRKPGGFPALDGTELTVLKALALAEGLAPFSKKQAYIYRRPEASPGASRQGILPPREILVELRKIMDRAAPDVTLHANDILYIPDSRSARASATVIEKAVAFIAGTASGALILSVDR